ncbi:MAG: patatin-like phospholipase family protein [Paramuribaculum sp.]|nr:patatin-like phospholipase family protein [Paramuribaculum sp.]
MIDYHLYKSVNNAAPYTLGIALSGGGARGVAHAGALKALSEAGVKPDIVAGVSAGSIVAALWGAGVSPDDMLQMFLHCKFGDFCSLGMPSDGFFRMDKFREILRKKLGYERIEQLPMPVVIGATNFDTGAKVAFERGPLADCVCASCSIPIVFKPVKIDGVRYVDGGVVANMPSWSIRERCHTLIGINVSPLSDYRPKDNLVQIALRSFELMSKNNSAPDMALCDMVIRTDKIARYKVFDLKGIEAVFESGYEYMNVAIQQHPELMFSGSAVSATA